MACMEGSMVSRASRRRRVVIRCEPIILGRADYYDRTSVTPSFPFPTKRIHTNDASKLTEAEFSVFPSVLDFVAVAQNMWNALAGTRPPEMMPSLRPRTSIDAFGSTGIGCGPGPAGGCARVKPRERADFTGHWKRSKAENLTELLEFCGLPRSDAMKARNARSIHLIEQDNWHDYFHVCTIKGERRVEDHFVIGHETPNVHASGGVFHESHARWEAGEQALVVTSRVRALGLEVVTVRTMDPSGELMFVSQLARRTESSESVHATMSFHRM
ncbi:unnamed protein product [Discosporangium mesarthrocarpum]